MVQGSGFCIGIGISISTCTFFLLNLILILILILVLILISLSKFTILEILCFEVSSSGRWCLRDRVVVV